MKVPRYGYHPSINKGYHNAIERVAGLGGQACQLWMGNSKGYAAKLIPDAKVKPARELVEAEGIFLIAHSPYLLNFARPLQKTPEGLKALNRYVTDLINVTNLGGVGSVLHMGANVKDLKQSMADAYQQFADNLKWVVKHKPKNAIIILENMAGGGTRMCCEMAEWSDFWNNYVDDDLKKHVRWCVDTAHLYATGEYDLSQRREVMRFYRDFDKHIGWEYLLCFHFNGSKSELGSHHDHHADIGPETSGLIESKGMRQLARIAGATDKPIILEVPIDDHTLTSQFHTIESWFEC